MPTVYRVWAEEEYKALEVIDYDAGYKAREEGCWKFDGNPVGESWEPLDVHPVGKKKSPEPDIWLINTAFAFEERVAEILKPALLESSELLPLPMDERALLIANIYLVDCLDKEVAIYNPEFTYLIEKYAFDPKCLTHSLFKIPQIYTEIFVAEGLGNPESEFKYLVEKNELTGLRFEKMWSSQ